MQNPTKMIYEWKPGWGFTQAEFDFTSEPLGLLLVWEERRPGYKYVLGVDTADGVGEDRCCVQVNRVATLQRPDEQVAELTININPLYLAPMLNLVGNYYHDDEGLPALLTIEVQREGVTLQEEMITRYKYYNLYIRTAPDSATNAFRNLYGIRMDVRTKPAICARGVKQIRDAKCKINSPWLVAELGDFEYNEAKREMAATGGNTDDRVMAYFIALYASHDWTVEDGPSIEHNLVDTEGDSPDPVGYLTGPYTSEQSERDWPAEA